MSNKDYPAVRQSLRHAMHLARAPFPRRGAAIAVALLISPLASAQSLWVQNGSTQTASGTYATTGSSQHALLAMSGSVVNGSQVTVLTSGNSANGIYALNGGNVSLTNSFIKTTGSQANGAMAFGSNAVLSLDNTSVQTQGDWASGIQANGDSTVTVQGGSVTTSGQDAYGLYNIGSGANLSASGTVVVTSGAASAGAFNQAGGLMTLDDVSIVTTGNNSPGVQIGSRGVIGNGSTSNTTLISNSSVTTLGDSSAGLLASDNATLNATDVVVSTTGAGSFGAESIFGAQTSIQGGSIRTAGDQAAGMLVAGMPATSGDPGTNAPTITANGLEVSTSGLNAPAAYLAGGASLAFSNGTLSASGAGSDALDATYFDTTAPAIANITNSTLTSTQRDGLLVSNATLDATLTGSTVTAGTNALEAVDRGVLNVVADASTLTGTTNADPTSTLSATLQNGSVWNVTGPSNLTSLALDTGTVRFLSPAQINAGSAVLATGGGTFDTNGFDAQFDAPMSGPGSLTKAGSGTLTLTGTGSYLGATNVSAGILRAGAADVFSPASGFKVSAGAVLDLNSYGQTVAGLANGGTIRFGETAGTTLNVTGDYVGNGGLLAMNTELGDSSSLTDLLHVSGSTSGSTGVQVTNTGGLGAQTTGDGIKLVQVDGASNGQFSQVGQVQAGAYEYTLYKGGVGVDASSGDWYLRSTLESPPRSQDEESDPAAPVMEGPSSSGAPVAYRPGAVGYVMTPQLDVNYGFAMLGRLDQRVGDVPDAVRPSGENANGVWGRVHAWSADTDALSRFSADTRSVFAQFGKDWTLSPPSTGGSMHAGITATFGNASMNFSDESRGRADLDTATGSAETQVQALGGYFTRYLTNGAYSDSVVQVAHFHNRYNDNGGNAPGQNGFSLSVSEEVGRPFQIASLPVAFEPQAQLMYQYMHLGAFSDNVSAISSTVTNALRGRLGFRIITEDMVNESGTSKARPYLTANVLHDFLAPGQTTVGETPFNVNFARTWMEFGLGVTATFGKRGEFYAAMDYNHSLGGQTAHGVSGNGGYRYSW
ncbi:outer membrane autotransporter protein [Paraburkholderia sp. HC6.4b]|uniref:autotransporter family protein n=1 Tax=unclassified Paraburkholderia TaxID=2615204 RepID=UPI00161FD7CF|nr:MULTISPECIES: autotransporter outer membrane beta-barrel domain-containing protein [unclassified Paraburkholderia]MBB5413898.1 outer membrane autotransporter protein [Paraburkholderia sp. HC6.4b]MBB5456313.1 outer membrane autotransporter protein [Paraburkholderia sp. Kb1A]